MKLITELVEQVEYITEKREDGKKETFIEGIFLQADLKNRNGRVYPMGVMENEVARYVRDTVDSKRAYGELGHPMGPQINLDRVSHLIVSLVKEGSNFIGKAKITDTPMGNIAKGLIESGANLGVSSRGLGSLTARKDGIMEVQADFRLATAADIVADPSAPDAFVKGIMEGAEWVYDPVKGTYHEALLHDMKKGIHGMSKNQLEEKRLSIFEDYIASLASKTTLL